MIPIEIKHTLDPENGNVIFIEPFFFKISLNRKWLCGEYSSNVPTVHKRTYIE